MILRSEKRSSKNFKAALEKLNALGIATKLVNRVHSKIVIGDDGLLCVDRSTGLVRHGKRDMNDTIPQWFIAVIT